MAPSPSLATLRSLFFLLRSLRSIVASCPPHTEVAAVGMLIVALTITEALIMRAEGVDPHRSGWPAIGWRRQSLTRRRT